MTDLIKLRPFVKHVERERHLPLVEICGTLEDARFVISALGQHVALDTIERGEDKWGAFVLVQQCERQLQDGFVLRLEPEYELVPVSAVLVD